MYVWSLYKYETLAIESIQPSNNQVMKSRVYRFNGYLYINFRLTDIVLLFIIGINYLPNEIYFLGT